MKKDKITNGSDKLKLMIGILSKAGGAPVTTGELMDALDCNRNSVNNYYKRCLQGGNEIKKTRVGHETAYYLDNSDTAYEPMTSDMVRKFLIMQRIRAGATQKKELISANETYGDEKKAGVSTSKYYSLIDELIKEGEILCIDGRYVPSGKRIPLPYWITEDKAYDYLDSLSMLPPGHHCHEQAESIYGKIDAILEGDDRDDDTYVILGRTYSLLNRIRILLSRIDSVDYVNNLMKVRFRGKDGKVVEYTIAVGLVAYSPEKDKLYIIGERRGSGTDTSKHSNKKDHRVFIDVEKIVGVSAEKGKNGVYKNKAYMELYNRMFSIGDKTDGGQVKIEFEDDEYMTDRFSNLRDYRKGSDASLSLNDEKRIYIDNIIGLEDFFTFLRQFTGRYRVVGPTTLDEKRKQSIRKMLKEYGED